jgi:hypothetical protein
MIQIGNVTVTQILIRDGSDVHRWVYRRFFVADGNFKADHIRQLKVKNDFWLSEGGGMMPRRDLYEKFLISAVERRTVTISF